MEVMPSQNMPVQRLKAAILPLDFPCCGIVTHSGEILTTGKSPKKPDGLLLTYSMEQSPSWEANRFSASQEISLILWNPKVHHRSHKCLPSVPILSQLD